jgi:hypothetical protein
LGILPVPKPGSSVLESAKKNITDRKYQMFGCCTADKTSETITESLKAIQTYWYGIIKYVGNFMSPYWISLTSFSNLEKEKFFSDHPLQTSSDYLNLLRFNLQVLENGFKGTFSMMNTYHAHKAEEAFNAWLNTFFGRQGEDIAGFAARQAKLLHKVVYEYPEAILSVKPDYGFHFEDSSAYVKFAETERFELWQVLPLDKDRKIRENGKPILILPPYVLGGSDSEKLPILSLAELSGKSDHSG